MTNASLIQIRRAGFRVSGKTRGLGLVLLYHDKLARVSQRAEALGYFLGPLALVGIAYPFVHDYGVIAAAVGVFAGRWLRSASGSTEG